MELMVESPFKTNDQIELAIDILNTHKMDVVINGVTNEDDIFYKQKRLTSLEPVSNNIYIVTLGNERDYIYRQTGGIFLSKYKHFIKSKNIFKQKNWKHCTNLKILNLESKMNLI